MQCMQRYSFRIAFFAYPTCIRHKNDWIRRIPFNMEQEVKVIVIWQKAPHGGPIPG